MLEQRFSQVHKESDELYGKFVKAIHEVQQKSGLKNLLLEKKLTALADAIEKKVSKGIDYREIHDLQVPEYMVTPLWRNVKCSCKMGGLAATKTMRLSAGGLLSLP